MRKPAVLTISIAFLLAVILAVDGGAAPIDEVVKAFERKDYVAAHRLARPLAEKGSPRAQNLLGYMYQAGLGAAKDYGEAMKWYRKAADQGDGEAQNNLGVMYENGLGVWEDHAAAVDWYARAAEQGVARAQNNLAIMYATGKGVEQDLFTAYVWFNIAAYSFPASDTASRRQALENRDNVAYNMSIEQVDQAKKLSKEWKPKKER